MGTSEPVTGQLLEAARRRGRETFGSALPVGLDNITAYVGLIGSALELAKLIHTEKRDLAAIDSHHKLEMTRMEAAFREVEIAMVADFQNDSSLRDKSFEIIHTLVASGQNEIALKFYERMISGFSGGALENIIQLRNKATSQGSTRIKLK